MPTQNSLSCLLIGEESLLIQCAEILLEHGHRIAGIVSEDEAILTWARDHDVTTTSPTSNLQELVVPGGFDYLFSIANLRMLPSSLLSQARRLAINFHDGPLPRYAGLYVTSWAILNGETQHGITWHEMTDRADGGRIACKRRFGIADGETAFSLNAKCYEHGMESFAGLVDALSRDALELEEQDFGERSYYGRHRRPRADGVIAWDQDAASIERLVRALDFGPNYDNPLCTAKVLVDGAAYVVDAVSITDSRSSDRPGTVVAVRDDGLRISTASDDLVLRSLRSCEGEEIDPATLAQRHDLRPGATLPILDAATIDRLDELTERAARGEERWARELGDLDTVDLPLADRGRAPSGERAPARLDLDSQTIAAVQAITGTDLASGVAATLALYFARLAAQSRLHLGFRGPRRTELLRGLEAIYALRPPARLEVDFQQPAREALETTARALVENDAAVSFARDLRARRRKLRTQPAELPIVLELVDSPDNYQPPPMSEMAIAIDATSGSSTWFVDTAIYDSRAVARLQDAVKDFAAAIAGATADQPLQAAPILSAAERERAIRQWNDTAVDYPRDRRIHELFEERVRTHPDAVALVVEDLELTYAELNARANCLAHHLLGLGAGPGVLIGVSTARDADMIVSVLAVLKSGAAYVPLDPEYPPERVAFMIEDAEIPILLTQEALVGNLPDHRARVIRIDTDWNQEISRERDTDPQTSGSSTDLAYVIYTSGSTGKPKGVMVEHCNVVNFFAGMDERIPHDPPGTWLTVTSLSFDISVLEIFWSLARGFKLVVHGGSEKPAGDDAPAATRTVSRLPERKVDFSLFYFSSDEGEKSHDKYRLLLEGARWADEHGFSAVWTPERHFHAFGGLYPNPAVTSAALATITRNVKIRSGSCVVPLHHPVRVAEEWALVDNLSGGRVGISFAAGWQPNDFLLRPESFADRKELMFELIEQVHALWRGETLNFPDGTGKDVAVRTLPRPIQKDLPTWITAAGNPETFRRAGEMGANVLTHLLGQSPEELAEKIKVYREAWKAAGHPGEGYLTLMLHTFVGTDDEEVKERVREPMKAYLRSSVGLIQKAAWSFPTFKTSTTDDAGRFSLDNLSEEDLDAVLDFSFERYFATSGLFGTPGTCLQLVDSMKEIGVDEIACLIDFGVESDTALEHLPLLDEVRRMANPPATSTVKPHSTVGELIRRHAVTHLQCTPSMASLLLASDDDRQALGQLKHLFVGGEALPAALAESLREAMPETTILNMYGPTETTIWSSTADVTSSSEPITIGTPIANNQIYILDANLSPVPPGVPGELCIGGDGVVRGYLGRPELTAERFVPDPFHEREGMRLYRTGDLARHREDGVLEFIGRMDHQVKVRGYRIELGEIEALLSRHGDVRECVVVAREDSPGDKRLVAYYLPLTGTGPDAATLRAHLRADLPEFMVPSTFVPLERFPLTPNLKVDRKALPAPADVLRRSAQRSSGTAKTVAPKGAATPVAAGSDLEQKIASIWQDVLGIEDMGTTDNFFDLGGHSLLTLQVHRQLKQVVETELTLVDMFKYPTIASLAGFIRQETQRSESSDSGEPSATAERSQKRAESRRESMARRRAARGRRART